MATHPDEHDDATRDPWLQQALRHAPDAEGRPGAAVREAVLRRAREAVATPPWWQRWWSAWRGASVRPLRLGYSGALIALVVVVVWAPWKVDEELRRVHEEAPPRSAAPAAVAQDPTAPASAAQSVPPTEPASRLPSAVTVLSPARPAEPARSSDPSARPKALENAGTKPAARPPESALPPSPPPPPPPQAAKKEATAAEPTTPPPPLRAEPPPAVPAAAAPLPAPPPAVPAPPRVSPAPPAPPRTLTGAAEGVRDTQASTSATARSGALSAATALRQDPLSPTPDLADRWQRWTLGERSGDAGPAQREWLQRLRATSAGCWWPAPANGLATPLRTLRLLAGEQTIAAAFVDPDGYLWWSAGAQWWRCNDRAAAGALDEAMRW